MEQEQFSLLGREINNLESKITGLNLTALLKSSSEGFHFAHGLDRPVFMGSFSKLMYLGMFIEKLTGQDRFEPSGLINLDFRDTRPPKNRKAALLRLASDLGTKAGIGRPPTFATIIDHVVGDSNDDAFYSFLHTLSTVYDIDTPQGQTQLHVESGLGETIAESVVIKNSSKDKAHPGMANTALASAMLYYFQNFMMPPKFSEIYRGNMGLMPIYERIQSAMQRNPGGNIEFGHFLHHQQSDQNSLIASVGKSGWMPTMTFGEGGHPGFLRLHGYLEEAGAIYASLVSVERVRKNDGAFTDVLLSAVFPHEGDKTSDYYDKRKEIFGRLHSSLLSTI